MSEDSYFSFDDEDADLERIYENLDSVFFDDAKYNGGFGMAVGMGIGTLILGPVGLWLGASVGYISFACSGDEISKLEDLRSNKTQFKLFLTKIAKQLDKPDWQSLKDEPKENLHDPAKTLLATWKMDEHPKLD